MENLEIPKAFIIFHSDLEYCSCRPNHQVLPAGKHIQHSLLPDTKTACVSRSLRNQEYDLPKSTEIFILISVCFDPHVPDYNSLPSAEQHLHSSLSHVPLLSVDLIK